MTLKNKNNIVKIIIFCIVLVIIAVLGAILIPKLISAQATSDEQVIDEEGPWEERIDRDKLYALEDFGLFLFVDRGVSNKDSFVISGWAFIPGETANNKSYELYIENVKSKKTYLLKTFRVRRTDVVDAYGTADVLNSGFSASFPHDKIELGSYKLYLKMEIDGNTVMVDTERTIDYIGPLEYENNELNRLFEERLGRKTVF